MFKKLILFVRCSLLICSLSKLVNGKSYSIITDHLGTPFVAYDENGKSVWKQELDIYGKVRNFTGDKTFIPFRYQGQYEDIETGLYYNRYRYYDPNSGIYISQDPIRIYGSNPNIYAYVGDVNSWIDPFGLSPCSKTFNELVGSKKFKDHFLRHKKLIEGLTGKKYKWKTDQKEFLDDIKKLIDDDILKQAGQSTLAKDQPILDIFRSADVTTAIKDLGNGTGEWVTSITRGEGMDKTIDLFMLP